MDYLRPSTRHSMDFREDDHQHYPSASYWIPWLVFLSMSNTRSPSSLFSFRQNTTDSVMFMRRSLTCCSLRNMQARAPGSMSSCTTTRSLLYVAPVHSSDTKTQQPKPCRVAQPRARNCSTNTSHPTYIFCLYTFTYSSSFSLNHNLGLL